MNIPFDEFNEEDEEYYEELEAEAVRKSAKRISKPKMVVDGMDSVRLIDYLQRTRHQRKRE